jgi:hypothetical protein
MQGFKSFANVPLLLLPIIFLYHYKLLFQTQRVLINLLHKILAPFGIVVHEVIDPFL